jgi:DDE superfamily endonuclease
MVEDMINTMLIRIVYLRIYHLKYNHGLIRVFKDLKRNTKKTNIPKKSTKKKPLTQEQKEENKLISSYRVVAEHALAGIKRMQSCVQTIRSHIDEKADKLILIATGIWNFHLDFRS